MQRRLPSNSCSPLIQFTVLGSSISHIQKLENPNCWQSTNENRSPLDTKQLPGVLEVCGVSKAQAPLRVVREGDRVMQPFLPPPISARFSSELPQRHRVGPEHLEVHLLRGRSQPLWGGRGKNLPFLLGNKRLWWLLDLDSLLLSLLQGTSYLKKISMLNSSLSENEGCLRDALWKLT